MEKPLGPSNHISPYDLYCRIKDCKIVKDPEHRELDPEQFFDPSCRVYAASEGFRRKVYFINNASGKFYLKLSPVKKKKDRIRFFLLPWRVTAEWRNLSRLRKKGVPAPQRVFFGYKGRFPCSGFFLVTEEVRGSAADCRRRDHVIRISGFLAELHEKGIFHRDIHPENIMIESSGHPVLLDAQEVYFFPRLPRKLKAANLGRLWRHIRSLPGCGASLEDFLEAYNSGQKKPVSAQEVNRAAGRSRERCFRSRSKRCFKNSSEFQVVKNRSGIRGFRRRDFQWGRQELLKALEHGSYLKGDKLIAYNGVCIKIHNKRFLHKDRCLKSWKTARALSVRGVDAPPALAFYSMKKRSFFLACFLENSLTLNRYFSEAVRDDEKKEALRRFAEWLRACHDMNIWQRDFKSSNVLVLDGRFMMVDLEGVKICRRLSWRRKVINLAQLNASISSRITLKDRLRFFYFYCGRDLPSREERRRVYEKIREITRGKNTLPFGLDPEKV